MEEARGHGDPAVDDLLEHTDILVDGPYVRELPDTARRWIGSTNQRIHFLADRYRADDPCWRERNTLEIRVRGGEVSVNGFPAPQAVGLWKKPKRAAADMSDTPPPPKSVCRFEANLLRILRFFLKQVPAEQALRHVHDRLERPKCLSAAAVDLVQDSLAKGCVLYLVRAGAWKRDRFLRDGEPKFGRLWERSPVEELTLTFSKHALDFLIWVTAPEPKEERPVWRAKDENLTVGDRLLFFLAYEAMRVDAEVAAALRQSPVFGENALVWLAHPNDFAGDKTQPLPTFDLWLTEPGQLRPGGDAAGPRAPLAGDRADQGADRRLGAAQPAGPGAGAGAGSVRRRGGRGRPAGPGAVPAVGHEPGAGPPGHGPDVLDRRPARVPARRGWPTGWRRSGTPWRFCGRPGGSASGSGRPAGAGTWTRTTRPASSGSASGSGSTFGPIADRADRVLQQVEPLRIG